MNIPMLAGAVDRRLVAIIGKQLASWGHAHFTTDAPAKRTTPRRSQFPPNQEGEEGIVNEIDRGQRDENWPIWYTEYLVAEQAGRPLPV